MEAIRIGLESSYLIPVNSMIEGGYTVFYFKKSDGKQLNLMSLMGEPQNYEVTGEPERNRALWLDIFDVIAKDLRTVVKEHHYTYREFRATHFGVIEVYDGGDNLIGTHEISYSRDMGYTFD